MGFLGVPLAARVLGAMLAVRGGGESVNVSFTFPAS